MAKDPNDPGAIHLYIHLTEWSDDPHKAIPYGEKLALLAPAMAPIRYEGVPVGSVELRGDGQALLNFVLTGLAALLACTAVRRW